VAPPPPSRQAAIPPQLNPLAAPSSAAQKPVTEEPMVARPGPPGNYNELMTTLGDSTGVPGGLGGRDLVRTVAPPPPPPPVPVVTRRAGGDIKYPARTYYVEPAYSAIARAAGVEGYVILEATIDESGAVRNLTVLKSQHPMLTPLAVEAVGKWKYTPTRLNGVAIPVILTVTVNFSLR
jgi:protein TonB